MKFFKSKSKLLVLASHLLVLIIYHQFGYLGHYGYDDLQYAEIANNLNHGVVDFSDHFTYRFPLILLTSLSFLVFGVNDFASAISSLLATITILIIVYRLLERKSTIYLSLGLSFTLFNHWFIFYSDKLMPDMFVALAFLLAIVVLRAYYFSKEKKKITSLYSFFLATTVLFGFTCKGTIVLLIPLLGYFFITDLILKRHQSFWLQSLLFAIVMFTSYLGIIGWLTGDFLARFRTISDNSYLNFCSYDQQPLSFLIKRIFYEFYKQQIDNGLLVGLLFVLPFLTTRNFKKLVRIKDESAFFIICTLVLVLIFKLYVYFAIKLYSYVFRP